LRRRSQLLAVVGGIRLAAICLALVLAILQDSAPATGAGITPAGTVGVYRYLLQDDLGDVIPAIPAACRASGQPGPESRSVRDPARQTANVQDESWLRAAAPPGHRKNHAGATGDHPATPATGQDDCAACCGNAIQGLPAHYPARTASRRPVVPTGSGHARASRQCRRETSAAAPAGSTG